MRRHLGPFLVVAHAVSYSVGRVVGWGIGKVYERTHR